MGSLRFSNWHLRRHLLRLFWLAAFGQRPLSHCQQGLHRLQVREKAGAHAATPSG